MLYAVSLLEDLLKRLVSRGSALGAEFTEARSQTINKMSVTVKDGKVEVVRQGEEAGVAIRVLFKGAWGFVTIGRFDEELANESLSDAVTMARVASGKLKDPVSLAPVKAIENRVVAKPRKDPRTVPIRDKIALALSLSNSVLSRKAIRSCTVEYADIANSTKLANSEGTCIEQERIYVWLRAGGTARKGDVFASAGEEVGSTSGYDLFNAEPPESIAKRIVDRLIQQLKAKPPKGGRYPAVLGSRVVGVLAHEAFGHLAEADLTLSGSVIFDKMGQTIASEATTICDDGTVEGGFGSFKYDDEGVPAQRTVLVERGVMKGLMHSRETAGKLGMEPTGNARAEDFRHEPLIRMRNTYFERGDHTLEELVEEIKFGYYLDSMKGGQANLDGTFQVGVQAPYEIVDGEIRDPVRSFSISGNTLEALHGIEAVGKDFHLWAGRCGKGQTAFIGDGGASVRVSEVYVGGPA